MLKQAVQTFLGVSLVHVITATMEMDSIVLTSMSATTERIVVLRAKNAQTMKVDSRANMIAVKL